MASFEDYDEFGNYIGADLDSDEEDAVPQNDFAQNVQPPLTGYDEEPTQGKEEYALMEIDGMVISLSPVSPI
jgi:U5 small nuclear ribonucleoprotein component